MDLARSSPILSGKDLLELGRQLVLPDEVEEVHGVEDGAPFPALDGVENEPRRIDIHALGHDLFPVLPLPLQVLLDDADVFAEDHRGPAGARGPGRRW